MTSKHEWFLKAESELRCELTPASATNSDSSPFIVKLVEGNAEVFGIELAQNKEYSFREDSFAVFTWYGCKLETSGEAVSTYVSDKTPMIAYVNTHAQLEARRDVALANSDEGPRVLIVGSVDQGKSSLSKILASYAVRLDRTPVYVDLDVGQGALSIPGTICAVPLDKTCLAVEVTEQCPPNLPFPKAYSRNPSLPETLWSTSSAMSALRKTSHCFRN